MSLRLILTVDEGEAAELVALLAKALGRGELGIMDFRLEAFDVHGRATPYAAPAKLAHAPAKKGAPRGRALKPTGGGRLKALLPALEKGPLTFKQMTALVQQAGFAGTGLGSAIAHWVRWGFIEKVGVGLYRLKKAPPQ
jgi:hypothetical protein